MSNNEMEIPVIRNIQQGKTLYIGKMTGKQILEKCITTEWDPALGWDLNRQGYQRAPNEKHYSRIASFLRNEGDPLLPTSALFAAREDEYGTLDYSPYDDSRPDIGILRIPEVRLLFIVDYQHRWRGIKHAVEKFNKNSLLDFQVPVIIMADVSRYEEIRQFYLINSKQKRVDTDLGLALLQTMSTQADEKELANFVGPGNKYRIRATRLTFAIASQTTGPWGGKILDPNMVVTGNQVVSIKSFVDSLKPILVRTSPICQKKDNELIGIILDYWSGIEKLMPRAFTNPRDYSLQRAVGVFVMNRIAGRKVFQICSKQNDFSSSNIERIMNEAKEKLQSMPSEQRYLDDDFWKIGGFAKAYSSSSGQNDLADRITSLIE